MSSHHFSTKTIGDVDALLPGFKAVWKQMKAECHTSQRCPKSVTFSDTPTPCFPHDYEIAKRFALNLETMELSESRHISAGEWACHGGPNNDQAVTGIPANMALITCTYNDFHRSFSMTIQVAKLPEQVTQNATA